MISEGRSINVTLIFSIDRYDEVIEAYLSGLEALVASGTDDLSHVASVASFFISRVDTEVDRRIEAAGPAAHGDELLALRGKAAVAQARLAYRLFHHPVHRTPLGGPGLKGARVQRPLWASTSTKNPAYPDLPTSTPSSARTRSTPCRTGRWPTSSTMARWPGPSTPTWPRPTHVIEPSWPMPASTWTTWPGLRGRGCGLVRQVLRRTHAVTTDKANALSTGRRPGATHGSGESVQARGVGLHATPEKETDEDRHGRSGQDGGHMTQRLIEHGHEVVAFDLSEDGPGGGGQVGRRTGLDPRGGGRPSSRPLGWRG